MGTRQPVSRTQEVIEMLHANTIIRSEIQEDKNGNAIAFSIVWQKEDVLMQFNELFNDNEDDPPEQLTDQEIDTILRILYDGHDCNYGTTWDSLNYAIENTIEDRKRKCK